MRLSTNIMLFIVILNLVPGVMGAAGVWDDWGIEVSTGVGEDVEEVQSTFQQTTEGGAFGGETLIGAILLVIDVLEVGYSLLFALPTMMSNLGVPFLGIFINALVPIIVGIDLLGIIGGRDV